VSSGPVVERLFEGFVEARERGEQPNVADLLAAAGPAAGELGRLIDAYLRMAPVQPPDEDTLVLMQARLAGNPPLLTLRLRRKLTRDAVVGALVTALRLDPAKTAKVGGYYHELETGLLPTAGVDVSVWDALREVLGANVRALAARAVPVPPLASPAFLRERNFVDDDRPTSAPVPQRESATPAATPEPDEVDRLFTGASDPRSS
jgi:hypothetical protein